MQSFCAKKFDFYGTTSIQPAYCPFFVQVDAENSKNEYICVYMQRTGEGILDKFIYEAKRIKQGSL